MTTFTNIILDAASTGILTVERDSAAKEPRKVRFSLVGTMNPEEGSLRPQLLDRFGLVARVESVQSASERRQILETVLRFEKEAQDPAVSEYLEEAYQRDLSRRAQLSSARDRLNGVKVPDSVYEMAAAIAASLKVEGHRGELSMLRAARAAAAIEGELAVSPAHLEEVAPMALVHRRGASDSGTILQWSEDDEQAVRTVTAAEKT